MKNIIYILTLLLIPAMAFGLNPKRGYEFTPGDFGMTFDEVKIESDDDIKLTGWFIHPINKSKKCVVFCHGGEGNMQEYIEQASNFISLGYNVLMFDYRGYGTSSEFNVSNKFYIYSQFANDVTAALNWVKKYKAVMSVDMYGVGIGAGLAVSIAANREEVMYAVGDGAYASLESVQKNYKEVNGSKILIPFGYDKVYMEPKFALESAGGHLKGVLLIQSNNDPIITREDMEAVSKQKGKKIKVYWVDSETNAENFETDKDTYFSEIKSFLGIK